MVVLFAPVSNTSPSTPGDTKEKVIVNLGPAAFVNGIKYTHGNGGNSQQKHDYGIQY